MNLKTGILATLVLFASLLAGLLWLSWAPSPVPTHLDAPGRKDGTDRSSTPGNPQMREGKAAATPAGSEPEAVAPLDEGFHPITRLSTETTPAAIETDTGPKSLGSEPSSEAGGVSDSHPSPRIAEAPKPDDSPATIEPPRPAPAASDRGPSRKKASRQPASTGTATATLHSPSKAGERSIAAPQMRRRPAAPAGLYETVALAAARSAPSDTASVIQQIRPGVRLNVTGARDDWLVVYSRQKRLTVYVHRDDAMYLGLQQAQSTTASQDRWTEIERDIREVLAKYGVKGIEVSFIGDTAYLKGKVETDRERERAVLFTRSVPAVKHVFNGVRVEP